MMTSFEQDNRDSAEKSRKRTLRDVDIGLQATIAVAWKGINCKTAEDRQDCTELVFDTQ